MIRIENLVKSYGSHQVLQGINLEVKDGELYGFIGHNGSGKSTTMNILSGLMDFQRGKCIINNHEVKKGSPRMFKEIGYLPEEPKFYQYMNSWEYLRFIGTMGGDGKKEIKEKSEKLLDLVKLSKDAKRAIGGYSRGMKQRLGIAVAIYHDPKVLFLDEPSSALDPEGRKDVLEIITKLKNQGKTIFLSTHILNDIERVCDRVGILHQGWVVLEENLDMLMKRYILPVYDIEFERALKEEELLRLNSLDYLEKVVVDDLKVSIWYKEINQNRNRLVRLLGEMEVPITSLNLRKTSLEEIFLKVVQ